MAVCYRYANDRDEAEDYFQEGLTKVFMRLSSYQFQGSFEGWAKRIVVNNNIDIIRGKKIDYQTIEEDAVFENLLHKHDTFTEDEPITLPTELVMQEVQKLAKSYRTVFNLYVIEGYTHSEIGEILGISEGTSKSNLSKAREHLKKALSYHLANNE